jgi:hypothetical protein
LQAGSLHGRSAIQVRLPVVAGGRHTEPDGPTPATADGVSSPTKPPAMPAPAGRD